MLNRILFALGLLLPQTTHFSSREMFIVWNVGQGSWFTFYKDSQCLHIDMGGSRAIRKAPCYQKENMLFLTHYDLDHLSYAQDQSQKSRLCLANKHPKNLHPKKIKKLKEIPTCNPLNTHSVQKIYESSFVRRNESHTYLVNGSFLITGDSDSVVEKRWMTSPSIKKARWLLLGHHGSRTSTSHQLLRQLPNLRMTFVSALKRKYGHPHSEVVSRLNKLKLPVITTEDFGSIAIELPMTGDSAP